MVFAGTQVSPPGYPSMPDPRQKAELGFGRLCFLFDLNVDYIL